MDIMNKMNLINKVKSAIEYVIKVKQPSREDLLRASDMYADASLLLTGCGEERYNDLQKSIKIEKNPQKKEELEMRARIIDCHRNPLGKEGEINFFGNPSYTEESQEIYELALMDIIEANKPKNDTYHPITNAVK